METERYRSDLTETLGSGSYSSVYLGHSKKDTDIKVAVKEIKNDSKERGRFSESAKKEFFTMKKACDNVNILQFLEFKATDRYIYFIMEFCDLGDLEKYTKSRPLLLVQKLDIMMQCANGVACLHNMEPPIIHRDLKPQNILIKESAQGPIVKVSDFGLSKVLEENKKQFMTTEAGSPKFRAPELFKQGRLQYTSSVDVFALGLVFMVLLKYNYSKRFFSTFEPYDKPNEPFIFYGLKLLLCRQEKKPFPVLFELTSDLDNTEDIELFICRMLKYEPDKRPTMDIVKDELKIIAERFAGQLPIARSEHKEKVKEVIRLKADKESLQVGIGHLSGKNEVVQGQNEARQIQLERLQGELEQRDTQIAQLKLQLAIARVKDQETVCVIQINSKPTYYQVQKHMELNSSCSTMNINGNKTFCTTDKSVLTYGSNGVLLSTVKFNYGSDKAHSALAVNSQQFIVSDRHKGVFLLNQDGTCAKRLCKGSFSDLHQYQGKVYGLEYNQDEVVVFEFMEQSWSKSTSIKLITGNLITKSSKRYHDRISVINDRIHRSSWKHSCILIFDMDGKLLSNYGQYGHNDTGDKAGLLHEPFLCNVDNSGTALIADCRNHRLQTCTATGEWQVITVRWNVVYPTYVVVTDEDQSIWVVSDWKTVLKMTTIKPT